MANRKIQSRRPRVLVTGAAGSVGHFLVPALVEAGYDVTALDVPGASFPEAPAGRVRVMEADLTAPGVPEKAVAGTSAVVHAAAVVDIARSWEELAPVNYHATLRLYEAAREAGVGHFVFFSTGSVYPGGPDPMTEDSPVADANDYVRTKLRAEEALRGRPSPPTVNVLRPALIYGPWGKVLAGALATVPSVLGLFTRHLPTLTGGPRSNWVHAEDVARAAAFLVQTPQPHGRVFNVAGDEAVPVGDAFSIAFRAGGLRLHPPCLRYPTPAMRVLKPILAREVFLGSLNRLAEVLYRKAARQAGVSSPLRPRLDKEALDFAVRDMVFDNRRLKDLGFTYRHPSFQEGWTRTQEWYAEHGWVPAAAGGQGNTTIRAGKEVDA